MMPVAANELVSRILVCHVDQSTACHHLRQDTHLRFPYTSILLLQSFEDHIAIPSTKHGSNAITTAYREEWACKL
jgi:hypothetical protein